MDIHQVAEEGILVDTLPWVLVASYLAATPGALYIIHLVGRVPSVEAFLDEAFLVVAFLAVAFLEEAFLEAAFLEEAFLVEAFLVEVPAMEYLSSEIAEAVGLKVVSFVLDWQPWVVSILFATLLKCL